MIFFKYFCQRKIVDLKTKISTNRTTIEDLKKFRGQIVTFSNIFLKGKIVDFFINFSRNNWTTIEDIYKFISHGQIVIFSNTYLKDK